LFDAASDFEVEHFLKAGDQLVNIFRKPVSVNELQLVGRKLAVGWDKAEADLFEGLFLLGG
jgi:hypothetical protein